MNWWQSPKFRVKQKYQSWPRHMSLGFSAVFSSWIHLAPGSPLRLSAPSMPIYFGDFPVMAMIFPEGKLYVSLPIFERCKKAMVFFQCWNCVWMWTHHVSKRFEVGDVSPFAQKWLPLLSIFSLVVLTILKNMKVNGKDDIPYILWTIKFMFETTKQFWC